MRVLMRDPKRGLRTMGHSRCMAAIVALPLLLGACAVDEQTGRRTGEGAVVGAASGAVIGLLTGNFLGTALTGAAAGATGGFVYDQITRK